MESAESIRLDSPGWVFFVKVSFACAIGGMVFGIVMMEQLEVWLRGYLVLGTLFLVGSTFTLSKTMRDEFEASKLINKLAQARTEKLLKEYEQEK
jgi:hypothetical protein